MARHLGPCWIALALLVSACRDGIGPTPPAPPDPPAALADASAIYIGNYTAILNVGERCAPEDVRNRTYSATIESTPRVPSRLATLVITLKDATFRQGCGDNFFAPGLGCNQFLAWTEDDRLRFILEQRDWGDGGQIWELLPGGDLVLDAGGGVGRLEGSTIEASGTADVRYFSTYCPKNDYRLTFTRR